MWRYLAGGVAAVLLIAASFLLIRSMAGTASPIPPLPVEPETGVDLASAMTFKNSEPPKASEISKEEKRFNRYDKDKNGAVAKEEYLVARRKAYVKLDVNGDGVLSFDEYAVKTTQKFAKADADKSGALNRSEFSTTRVVRKTPPKVNCPPAAKEAPQPEAGDDDA